MDQFPAGPELDGLIAEKVMGWLPHQDLIHWYRTTTGWRITRPHGPASSDHEGVTPFMPSTNIADAWEVIEKLSSLQPCVLRLPNGSWQCHFEWKKDGKQWGYVTDARTAPLAICRAALLTIERKS